MIEFLQIFTILSSGIGIGYVLRSLMTRQVENQKIRIIETIKIVSQFGEVDARISEWPIDGAEYFANILASEGFDGTLTVEKIGEHFDAFAAFMTSRQKRDFMKMLRTLKANEIIEKLRL